MLPSSVVAEDFELLDAWRAGDSGAGNDLFARHFDSLVRFFFTKVDDREIEDLIQRTMLACVEFEGRFRGDGSFRSYLFAIARNELRMFWRRRGRSRVDLANESVIDLGTSPSVAAAKSQEKKLLLSALRTLTVDQQILLELHYWQGMTAAELGALFEIDPTTARTRLHRARARLKTSLEQLCESPAEREAAMGGLETWAREIHLKANS